MTTIIDPLGTPVIVFNRDGVAIVSFTATRQVGSPPPATAIPNVSGHTIAYITADDNSIGAPWVELPTGADIGDVVEVYLKPSATGNQLTLNAPSGETINGGGGFTAVATAGLILRKIEATVWVVNV